MTKGRVRGLAEFGSVLDLDVDGNLVEYQTEETQELGCLSDEEAQRLLKNVVGEDGTKDEDCDKNNDENNAESDAVEICRLVGNRPLAIELIGTYMRNNKCSYSEFIHIYKTTSTHLSDRVIPPYILNKLADDEFTMVTIWDIVSQKISENARHLQKMLAFFNPDGILKTLLTDTKVAKKAVEDAKAPKLSFLADPPAFHNALMELERASMVRRMLHGTKTDCKTTVISMHRSTQLAVRHRMICPTDLYFYFDIVVRLLYHSFPNTWKDGRERGHESTLDSNVSQSQSSCRFILPHVLWLMEMGKQHDILSMIPSAYYELIFRAGDYLWRQGHPRLAEPLVRAGLVLYAQDTDSITVFEDMAEGHCLLGQICLDAGQRQAALKEYKTALRMWEALEEEHRQEGETEEVLAKDGLAIEALRTSIASLDK